jgi:lipid-A-disaccharide synthase
LKKYGISPGAFPLVSVLPGSRKSEIGKMWPLFLEASRLVRKNYPDAAFGVAVPSGFSHLDYPGLSPEDTFFFLEGPAYDLRKACDLAWVKSGTGTLETALLNKPMVMVYKMAALSAFLAKRLVKIPHFSLVNLLAGKKVIPELLQEKAEPGALARETVELLENPKALQAQLKAFAGIRKKISRPPKASRGAAVEILKLLGNEK